MRQLRWNNDDRASMPVKNGGVEYDEWFEAARVWNGVVTDRKNEYWEQLVPGRPVSEFLSFSFRFRSPVLTLRKLGGFMV